MAKVFNRAVVEKACHGQFPLPGPFLAVPSLFQKRPPEKSMPAVFHMMLFGALSGNNQDFHGLAGFGQPEALLNPIQGNGMSNQL